MIKNFKIKIYIFFQILSLTLSLGFGGIYANANNDFHYNVSLTTPNKFDGEDIPIYKGQPFEIINDGEPYFNSDEITSKSYEEYSNLDNKGRCTGAMACVGKDLMPKSKRGSISRVKPTGWNQRRFLKSIVPGGYLYNRCHLIAHELTGEDANNKNLITGTKYLNNTAMLPNENKVANYIKKYNRHVMYRSTPIFNGNDKVAKGVLLEALSVEDSGKGIKFCLFCFNVQPQISINYSTGTAKLSNQGEQSYNQDLQKITNTSETNQNQSQVPAPQPTPATGTQTMVWISSFGKKYHSKPNCSRMKNPWQVSVDEAVGSGKDACSKCIR